MYPTSTTASSIKDKTCISHTRNSTVYLLPTSPTTNKPEVLKVVPLRPDNDCEFRNQQFAAGLSKAVAKVHSGQRVGHEYHIRMEYCRNGALSEAIRQRAKLKTPWTSQELHRHTMRLVELMSTLHANRLAHRDLKPANFFVSHSGSLKLGDFGSSGQCEAAERYGTMIYMPPELYYWDGGLVDYQKADSFSLGKTLYEMATLRISEDLYSWYEDEAEYKTQLAAAVRSLSPKLQETLQGLMAFNPRDRWSCTQAWEFLQAKASKEVSEASTRSSNVTHSIKQEVFIDIPVVELSLTDLLQ